MPNRLANESSLYLRQHANNPVDWFPWGEEAIAQSRELDRPIFLSVGYSACHWCHVMEHESFEDEETAKILNDHFISIKVDREERPDLDQIYMTAHQVLNQGGGGWPLSVFLTPELQPFYAGTYFPPDKRYAPRMPSFRQLLGAIIEAWQERRDKLQELSTQVTAHLQGMAQMGDGSAEGEISADLLDGAHAMLSRIFDSRNGGFGTEPKFPHAVELRLLLRIGKRFSRQEAFDMVNLSLDKMARGGIYDQLGGGFHRYSVDSRWLVPHFEKMLYDNALLTSAYTGAWQHDHNPAWERVVRETLDYVLREMTSEPGAFFSTQDADSEGVEGKFYVWSEGEIDEILGDEAKLFKSVYDVSPGGNWEGNNILNRPASDEENARKLGISLEELQSRLTAAKTKLREARDQRVWPGRDEKILTAWNGMMIAAFAQAGAVFDEPRYVQAAQRAADFILTKMRGDDGRLFRTCAVGQAPKINAYLEDYSFLLDGLASLYEADFNPRWLEEAVGLAEIMMDQFADPQGEGFFYTGKDHESLIARSKDQHDGSTPSGNAMAVTALLRLGKLLNRRDFTEKAERTLRAFRPMMQEAPAAMGQMLAALDFHLGPTKEIVIVGKRGNEETQEVLRTIHGAFQPNRVIAFHDPDEGDVPPILRELFQDRGMIDGQPTVYICENYSCQAPVVGVEAIRESMGM